MRSTSVRRAASATAIVALALGLAACAGESVDGHVQSDPPSSETSREQQQQATEPSTADFVVEEIDGALVTSFPTDVPLYDGEIVASSASLSDVDSAPEWGVIMQTGDPLEAIDAAIRSDYASNGWTIASDNAYMGGYQLIARGNGYTVSITYNDMTGPMEIIYGVSSTA